MCFPLLTDSNPTSENNQRKPEYSQQSRFLLSNLMMADLTLQEMTTSLLTQKSLIKEIKLSSWRGKFEGGLYTAKTYPSNLIQIQQQFCCDINQVNINLNKRQCIPHIQTATMFSNRQRTITVNNLNEIHQYKQMKKTLTEL